MNTIKRFAGIIWMALGPITIYFLISTALSEIEKKPLLDTKIQWGVFVVVFIPIAIGIMIFGWYAFKGAYNQLQESSTELED